MTDMKILRQMSKYIRKHKIHNDYIKEKLGVAPIEKKMIKTQLWWFGHAKKTTGGFSEKS